jgi:DNA polymerase V
MSFDFFCLKDLIPFDAPEKKLLLPLALERASAGFPSPAENFVEKRIDLNDELIRHPNATYLVRNGISSDSMTGAGVLPNSMLIVDKDEETRSGHVVVARIEDRFTIKRLKMIDGRIYLLPENINYRPIEINTPDFEVWGRAIYVITKL